jgi:hypothetical protein
MEQLKPVTGVLQSSGTYFLRKSGVSKHLRVASIGFGSVSIKDHQGCFQPSKRKTAISLFKQGWTFNHVVICHDRLYSPLVTIPLYIILRCQILYVAAYYPRKFYAISPWNNLLTSNIMAQCSFRNAGLARYFPLIQPGDREQHSEFVRVLCFLHRTFPLGKICVIFGHYLIAFERFMDDFLAFFACPSSRLPLKPGDAYPPWLWRSASFVYVSEGGLRGPLGPGLRGAVRNASRESVYTNQSRPCRNPLRVPRLSKRARYVLVKPERSAASGVVRWSRFVSMFLSMCTLPHDGLMMTYNNPD